MTSRPCVLFRDEPVHGIHHVLYRSYPKFLVRNSNFEFIFDIKHKFDDIKRIKAQIFECRCGRKFLHIVI
jgi:hypothetical protein